MRALSLILSLFICGLCFADELVIEDKSALIGDTGVSVPVSLVSSDVIASLDFNVGYDSKSFAVAGVVIGEAAEAAGKQVVYSEPEEGTVKIVIFGLNQTTIKSGALVDVQFDVLETAVRGEKPLTLSDYTAADAQARPVNLTIDNGIFTILDDVVMELAEDKVIISNSFPEARLEKWGNEAHLKVWPDDEVENEVTLSGDKTIYKSRDEKKEYCLYPTTALHIGRNIAGFEYEVILKEKPETNIVTLNIETEDLKFYYQPPLTEEETPPEGGSVTETAVMDKNGNTIIYRPENIVGSYAVYHKDKKGYVTGQTNYATGKAFHIYRPRIVDADNWEVWGELRIYEETGLMTVTIPQDFIDKAVYPVKHATGATFGLTTQGGTAESSQADDNYACHATSGASGTGTYVHAWVGSTGGTGSQYFNLCVYDDDTGNDRPEDQLAVEVKSSIEGGDGAADKSIAYTPEIAAATKYWVALWPEHYRVEFYYDSGAANKAIYRNGIDDLPANWTDAGTNESREYSFYMEYTEDVSAAPKGWGFFSDGLHTITGHN